MTLLLISSLTTDCHITPQPKISPPVKWGRPSTGFLRGFGKHNKFLMWSLIHNKHLVLVVYLSLSIFYLVFLVPVL